METVCGNNLDDLDRLYVETLHFGLFTIRNATAAGQHEWAHALADFLHNIPSLIGERNAERHRYFWDAERAGYLDWVARHGSPEPQRHVRTYYEPIWAAMGPLIP